MRRFFRTILPGSAVATLLFAGSAHADVVTDWNNHLLDAIRATGGGPGPIAREGAMVQTAVFDAINSIDRSYAPMHTLINAPANTSEIAAGAQAAHDVLAGLFPAAQYPALNATFDADLSSSLAAVPSGSGKTAGINLGQAVSASTLAWRANDGSSITVPYTVPPGPGVWQPTYPDYTDAWGAGWGSVTPMVLNSGSQFRAPAPPTLTSAAYNQAVLQVESLGSLNSTTRTADETAQAKFWANDLNGTEKPPGQLNAMTQIVAAQEGNSLVQNARLFALINVGMFDASVAAWDTKFTFDLWRPIDAIRQANTVPGSTLVADPSWEPLSDQVNGFTPPFPAYVSGHATFAGTWAAIMAAFYGTNNIAFDGTSDNLAGTRHFDSFSAAAAEDAESRIYLGVHYQFDADYGLAMGNSVGNYVFSNGMQPVPEPGRMTMVLTGIAATFLRRRDRRGSRIADCSSVGE
jgi:hypothetical protein